MPKHPKPNLSNEVSIEQPTIAAISYEHFTSLLETVDILHAPELSEILEQSIAQAECGETIDQEDAK